MLKLKTGIFTLSKKDFNADNYFMENSAPLRKPFFCCPAPYYHQSVNVVKMLAKSFSELNTKYSGGIDCCSIHADPCIVIMKSSVKVLLDSVIHKNSYHPD